MSRRTTLNAYTATTYMGGNTESLPTTIVYSETPNEDNARIYEYLKSLKYELSTGHAIPDKDMSVYGIHFNDGYISIIKNGNPYYIYEDGSIYHEEYGSGGAD